MALPVLTKAHQFRVNEAILAQGALLATARRILRTMKDALIGSGGIYTDGAGAVIAPTNLGVVRRASNSVAVANSDNWAADADLVWATASPTVHSWIVIRFAGIAASFDVCLECLGGTTGTLLTVSVAPQGYDIATGTTGTRPSPSVVGDELTPLVGAQWGGGLDASVRLHALSSTDGQTQRIYLCRANVTVAAWRFEKPASPITGWAVPCVALCLGSNGNSEQVSTTAVLNAAAWRARSGAVPFTFFGTCEGRNGVALIDVMTGPSSLSLESPTFPAGFYSDSAGAVGPNAKPFDLWWGLSAYGTTYQYPEVGAPAPGARQFASFGIMVEPWNLTAQLAT